MVLASLLLLMAEGYVDLCLRAQQSGVPGLRVCWHGQTWTPEGHSYGHHV